MQDQPEKPPAKEDINQEEHWVYLSQLDDVIGYTIKAGANRVVIRVLPDPYKFSI